LLDRRKEIVDLMLHVAQVFLDLHLLDCEGLVDGELGLPFVVLLSRIPVLLYLLELSVDLRSELIHCFDAINRIINLIVCLLDLLGQHFVEFSRDLFLPQSPVMDVLLAAYEAVLKGKFTKHLFNGHLVLVNPVRWMFDLFF